MQKAIVVLIVMVFVGEGAPGKAMGRRSPKLDDGIESGISLNLNVTCTPVDILERFWNAFYNIIVSLRWLRVECVTPSKHPLNLNQTPTPQYFLPQHPTCS